MLDMPHDSHETAVHLDSPNLQIQEKPPFLAAFCLWSCGELNPGPMTVPSVFYVRSLLAKMAIFLPPTLSQTTVGEHIHRKSPLPALRLSW